jgi:hypothetical protein
MDAASVKQQTPAPSTTSKQHQRFSTACHVVSMQEEYTGTAARAGPGPPTRIRILTEDGLGTGIMYCSLRFKNNINSYLFRLVKQQF